MPNRRQAIIWTNADLNYWCIYAALGGDELTPCPAFVKTDQLDPRFRGHLKRLCPFGKFCDMQEGQTLLHDTKFCNCADKIVDSLVILSWSLIHGWSWYGLIKARSYCHPFEGSVFNVHLRWCWARSCYWDNISSMSLWPVDKTAEIFSRWLL